MDLNKYREDFLWFSYFGVTESDVEGDEKKAIMACAERAYLDLRRTIKYTYSTGEIDAGKKSDDESERQEMELYSSWKASYKRSINCKIYKKILGLLRGEDELTEEWYQTIIQSIIENVGEETRPEHGLIAGINLLKKPLSCGQAQKWVNMTIKNLLIMGKIPADDDMLKKIHIPLDSYIFKCAERKLGIEAPKTVWSQLDYEEYKNYQKRISDVEEIIPIEWEGTAWIEQAKAEKKNTVEEE